MSVGGGGVDSAPSGEDSDGDVDGSNRGANDSIVPGGSILSVDGATGGDVGAEDNSQSLPQV